MDVMQIEERVSAAVHGAIEAWGADAQLTHIQEELAELIVAISHLRRGRCDADHVAEEVADVILCMGTARVLVGVDLVSKHVLAKLERLEGRIARAVK